SLLPDYLIESWLNEESMRSWARDTLSNTAIIPFGSSIRKSESMSLSATRIKDSSRPGEAALNRIEEIKSKTSQKIEAIERKALEEIKETEMEAARQLAILSPIRSLPNEVLSRI